MTPTRPRVVMHTTTIAVAPGATPTDYAVFTPRTDEGRVDLVEALRGRDDMLADGEAFYIGDELWVAIDTGDPIYQDLHNWGALYDPAIDPVDPAIVWNALVAEVEAHGDTATPEGAQHPDDDGA